FLFIGKIPQPSKRIRLSHFKSANRAGFFRALGKVAMWATVAIFLGLPANPVKRSETTQPMKVAKGAMFFFDLLSGDKAIIVFSATGKVIIVFIGRRPDLSEAVQSLKRRSRVPSVPKFFMETWGTWVIRGAWG
ncbi:MAG: hypothetical protein AB1405_04200, partial [Bdellovibrionota bacterium]